MSLSDLSSAVLGWMADYGAPVVGLMLLIGSLGIPLPGTLIVIASGAFMRQELLSTWQTPLLAYLGAIGGDFCLYGLGMFAGSRIEKRFGSPAAWGKARLMINQRGGIAIYLTRWLLTALAFPVTLVAGSSRLALRRFALYDLLGELTWIGLYGGLGYAFGSQWELISEFISNFSGFILGAVVLGSGVYLMIKYGKKKPQPAEIETVEENPAKEAVPG